MILAALLSLAVSADSSSVPDPAGEGALRSGWNWLARDFSVLMSTSGQVDFAPVVFGRQRGPDPPDGYRSDFQVWVDFFRWKGFTSNWLIGNTTIMSRDDSTALRLSRIRYILTPGYRYEFDGWQVSGLLLHECVHTVSRPESEAGATWWNSFQIGAGTFGAYHDHLVEAYRNGRGFASPGIDGRIDFGQFLYGGRSVWIGRNHDFRQELFGTLRVRLGSAGPFGFFQDASPHLWRTAGGHVLQRWDLSTHMYLLGRHNIAGGYFRWIPLDQSPVDNEDGLGQIGFEIVF